jgi:hypothetical protein
MTRVLDLNLVNHGDKRRQEDVEQLALSEDGVGYVKSVGGHGVGDAPLRTHSGTM